MINAVIIEDELYNAQRLSNMLALVDPTVQVLAILEGVEESVTWLKSNLQPDLIFMDVRLTDGISFDIFTQVEVCCPIIFTSAFDQYALRAFKVNSVDYLLKPINTDELMQSLDKFKASFRHPPMLATLRDISTILQQQKKSYRTRFLLPVRDSYHALQVSEISYFLSEHKITKAITQNGHQYIIPFTLEDLTDQLDPDLFFRANRQYLISNFSISKIHNFFNGKLSVSLLPAAPEKLIISRDRSKLLKKWLDR
jgi:two-component system response regulator LytT